VLYEYLLGFIKGEVVNLDAHFSGYFGASLARERQASHKKHISSRDKILLGSRQPGKRASIPGASLYGRKTCGCGSALDRCYPQSDREEGGENPPLRGYLTNVQEDIEPRLIWEYSKRWRIENFLKENLLGWTPSFGH